MVMNKKGQTTIFFILMIGIVCFLLGMALTPVIAETAWEVSHTTELNCSSTSTTIQKSVCTQIDTFAPYYMGILFGLAGMVLAGIGIN